MDFIQLVWLYTLLCFVPGVVGGACRDIDSQACVLMAQQNPNLCQDQVLSRTACPQFCKICPLECYHCEVSVRDYKDCNATMTCDVNHRCMVQKMHSSRDGHDEYLMGCASLQLCDGGGLTLSFGRRALHERNVAVTCCDTDRCNLPMESTMVPTTTTQKPSCVRDIVLIVEDAIDRHDKDHLDYSTPFITAFLKELVASLPIGPADSLVELSLTDSDIHNVWPLNAHMTNDSLQTAISSIPFQHRQDNLDIRDIVKFLSQQAFDGRSGDRPSVANDVVIFVDHRARPSTSLNGHVNGVDSDSQHQVQQVSGDVIIVNIGPPDHSAVTQISVLATDARHVLSVSDYDGLPSIKDALVHLLCN